MRADGERGLPGSSASLGAPDPPSVPMNSSRIPVSRIAARAASMLAGALRAPTAL